MKLKDPEKRDLIFNATLQLVRQNGLSGLNMAAISKKTKLGTGTVYVYFKSKEDLINSLFKNLKGNNIQRIYSSVELALPFKVNMKKLFENYVNNRIEFFDEHFFVEQCSNSHYLDKEARMLDEQAFVGIFALLNKGKKELLIKDLDNDLITAYLMGSANEIVNACIKNKNKITRTLLNHAFELCWDGIKR